MAPVFVWGHDAWAVPVPVPGVPVAEQRVFGQPGSWLRAPSSIPESFGLALAAALLRFMELTGIAASATLYRAGLGSLGGEAQTVPRGELEVITAALRAELPSQWLIVTDHLNHVRSWGAGKDWCLASPLSELWGDFWSEAGRHPDLLLIYTPSHREKTLARDLSAGKSRDCFLGNLFADIAAEQKQAETGVPAAVVTEVAIADAMGVLVLKRLVALGIQIAELPRPPPPSLPALPRPDISALLAASQHNFQKVRGGYRCSACEFVVTRAELRKGEDGYCIPADGVWIDGDGRPIPPPPNHPECERIAVQYGFDTSHQLGRTPNGVICWRCGAWSESNRAVGLRHPCGQPSKAAKLAIERVATGRTARWVPEEAVVRARNFRHLTVRRADALQREERACRAAAPLLASSTPTPVRRRLRGKQSLLAAVVYLHSAVTAETPAAGPPNPDALIEDPDLELAALPLENLVDDALSPADAARVLLMAGAFYPDSEFVEPDPQELWG